MRYLISTFSIFSFAVLFIFASGCSSIEKRIADDFQIKNAPVRVAVLPFDVNSNRGKEKEIAETIRKIFFSHFSYLGYIDMSIKQVDKVLAENNLTSTDDIYLLTSDYLGNLLGVDALIYCKLRKVSNLTAGIFAETSIEAELKMIDIRTGSIIWEANSKETEVNGILYSSTLLTLIQKQIDNSNQEIALTNIAEKFSKKVVNTIPDPASFVAEKIHLPKIYSLHANINDKNKDKAFILEVSMNGEKEMEASFDIGDWKTSIPMREESPGNYFGYYMVKNEDYLQRALIVGKLENRRGLISKKIYEKGLVGFGPVY